MKDGVLNEGVSAEGTYKLSTKVNGKESWTTSSNAIWYIPEYKKWGISYLAYRGTKRRFISSRFVYDLEQPYDVEYWDTWRSGSWEEASATDVTVKCET